MLATHQLATDDKSPARPERAGRGLYGYELHGRRALDPAVLLPQGDAAQA